jgi:hypothetical protein
VGDVVVKLGKNQDYLISILGDSTKTERPLPYASGNSLTLAKATIIEDEAGSSINFDKLLVLGDLTETKAGYGTGLFAKNVYL